MRSTTSATPAGVKKSRGSSIQQRLSQTAKLQAEVFALQKKLKQSTDKNRELERDQEVNKAFMAETSGNLGDCMELVRKKQRRIDDLRTQQHNYALLTPHFSSVPFEHLDFSSLQRGYANLRSRLVNVGLRFSGGPTGEQRAELLASSPGLGALVSLLAPDKSSAITSVDMNHLVQSIVAVAVRDWVFFSEFASPATTAVPLLEVYRHQLSTLYGPEFLRNLDFAAHCQVFHEDSFKETIPGMASTFERRLVNALDPILLCQSKCNYERTLQQDLDGMFCAALELKLLAIVSKSPVECVWPDFGTPFNPDTMATERGSFFANDLESHPSKTVQLVLIPGLRVCKEDKQMVDYFGFRREHQQCTGSYQTLQKAVVLLV